MFRDGFTGENSSSREQPVRMFIYDEHVHPARVDQYGEIIDPGGKGVRRLAQINVRACNVDKAAKLGWRL